LINRVWLSLGCFPEVVKNTKSGELEYYNTHYIVNDDGIVVSKYRKMHLMETQIIAKGYGGMSINENEVLTKGSDYTEPCFSPVGYLGLSISYDIRFPELYRRLFLGGA
jgi:predicted amidohydrolase